MRKSLHRLKMRTNESCDTHHSAALFHNCRDAFPPAITRFARWPVFHRPGRYITANLAEAGKMPVFLKSVHEAGILNTYNLQ